jgi:RimJ/RimL family protein N-acetyltransferase
MRFRPTTEADLDRVLAVTVDEPVGWIDADRYLAELAERMYRPEWTWIAEEDDRVVARALWWGRSDSTHPIALDCLYVDPAVSGAASGDVLDEGRAAVAAKLLLAGLQAFAEQAVNQPVQYAVKLAGGWRDDPAAAAALAWRRTAALAAGLTDEVERLQFQWTPEAGLPETGGRLTFERAGDEEFVELFRRIAEGSLDAETRSNVAAMGAEATARAEVEFYLSCPGERDWWRVARTQDGEVAGVAVPSATPYHVNVGYLGVVPEMRGRGYVGELLAEITAIHAAAGAQIVTATTDLGNAPMAAAFRRAGYRNTEVRMAFSTPSE